MSLLFGKRTEVLIQGKVLENPPLSIDFELPFSDDEKENVGNIKLYNLAESTKNLFVKDAYIILKSGYVGSIGTISTLTVKESSTRIEGVDRITEVTVGEEDGRWKNTLINSTWRADILASQVIGDIVKVLGLTVGEITLPIDFQYPRGKTFSKSAKLCLIELVTDCGAIMTYTRGTIYIRPPGSGTQTGFVLNKSSGLIESPENIEDDDGNAGYKVLSLMNYKIEVGSIIKIESKKVSGIFKVKKGIYRSTDFDHVVEMEVFPI